MNIRESLIKDNSKAMAVKISSAIGNSQEHFSELMQLFLHDEPMITQRASWVLSHCADNYPELILPWITPMVENLKKDINDAVKRNTVRVLQFVDIPEEEMGELADVCFNFLASAKEPIAVKVFSMTILFNLCKKIPELKNELLPLIEDQMPFGSAGFRSRGKKIITAFTETLVFNSLLPVNSVYLFLIKCDCLTFFSTSFQYSFGVQPGMP